MTKVKLSIILLLLCTSELLIGQESVVLNVLYEFRYVRDLENIEQPYVSNMVLSVGRNTSRYCSEKLYLEKTDLSTTKKKRGNDTPSSTLRSVGGGPLLHITNGGVMINEEITKNNMDKKMNINATVAFRNYVISADIPKIGWQIQKETKKIGNYKCQKAIGKYAGRVYEAWFAPDLPIQDGPWKLSGLPGLILEAKDQDNEVAFLFKEMTRNMDTKEITHSYIDLGGSIKTNIKDYYRIKEAFEKDPEAIAEAQFPYAKLYIKNIDNEGNKTLRKIKKYNAIERNL